MTLPVSTSQRKFCCGVTIQGRGRQNLPWHPHGVHGIHLGVHAIRALLPICLLLQASASGDREPGLRRARELGPGWRHEKYFALATNPVGIYQ
jgi:hypothetical protein